MNWTLLVPGALVPPGLAPELTRNMRVPVLTAQLALARPLPARPAAQVAKPPATGDTQSPHWQWLANRFGLGTDNLATAPYAWRDAVHRDVGSTEPRAGAGEDAGVWIAHCEPVHMAIARDHFVVTDLAAAPLLAAESAELLQRANAVLAGEAAGSTGAPVPRLRIAVCDDRWFLLASRPLQLVTWSLDAVLGQSVQYRLPTGADARRWRVLANEIQMSWHASDTNEARESAGQRTANGLWLHGGGVWQRLAAMAPMTLHAPDAPAEAAVLRGWLDAAAPATAAPGRADGGTLSICRALFNAHAHQAWESWLGQLPLLEARIAADLAAARSAHASRFDLVLCGNATTRTVTLPLQPPWWRRLRAGTNAPAALLQRWLTEAPPAAAAERAPSGKALAA